MNRLTMETARELLQKTTTQPQLLQHALAVSAAMGAMARHFGAEPRPSTGKRSAFCTIMTISNILKSICGIRKRPCARPVWMKKASERFWPTVGGYVPMWSR